MYQGFLAMTPNSPAPWSYPGILNVLNVLNVISPMFGERELKTLIPLFGIPTDPHSTDYPMDYSADHPMD